MPFASASTDSELCDETRNFWNATVRRVFETYDEASKYIRTAQKKNTSPQRGFVIGQKPLAVQFSTTDNIPYNRELITAPYVAIYEPVRADVANKNDPSEDDSDGEDCQKFGFQRSLGIWSIVNEPFCL